MESILNDDYVEPLLKARTLLKDTEFGLLVNDNKFETALITLRLARALLKQTEMLLILYQHKKEELEVIDLTKKLGNISYTTKGQEDESRI